MEDNPSVEVKIACQNRKPNTNLTEEQMMPSLTVETPKIMSGMCSLPARCPFHWLLFGLIFVCTYSNVFRGVVSRDLASTTRLHRCAQARNYCAHVFVCDSARHHVHAINDTRATNSHPLFQRAPRSQRQRDGPQLPHANPCNLASHVWLAHLATYSRVTVYTHIHTLTSFKKASDHCHRTPVKKCAVIPVERLPYRA